MWKAQWVVTRVKNLRDPERLALQSHRLGSHSEFLRLTLCDMFWNRILEAKKAHDNSHVVTAKSLQSYAKRTNNLIFIANIIHVELVRTSPRNK